MILIFLPSMEISFSAAKHERVRMALLEVGEVFSAKVDAQCVAVFLKSVGVFQI